MIHDHLMSDRPLLASLGTCIDMHTAKIKNKIIFKRINEKKARRVLVSGVAESRDSNTVSVSSLCFPPTLGSVLWVDFLFGLAQ